MVSTDVILVDALLDEPQTERFSIKLKVLGDLCRDGSDVMDGLSAHVFHLILRISEANHPN